MREKGVEMIPEGMLKLLIGVRILKLTKSINGEESDLVKTSV